jgi:hypothetical protein
MDKVKSKIKSKILPREIYVELLLLRRGQKLLPLEKGRLGGILLLIFSVSLQMEKYD